MLLVFPPADIPSYNIRNVTPPLGIAYLGAVLENSGHKVTLLDCQVEGYHNVTRHDPGRIRFGLSPDEIARHISDIRPDVVGASCLFSQMSGQAKDVLRIAKRVQPEATTVFGGLHASLFPEDPVSDPSVDIVLRGQGENNFPKLLETLETRKNPLSVPGVRLRGIVNGDPDREGPPPQFIKDLDGLPFPARHLLPMDAYFSINMPHGGQVKRGRVAQVLTSRGCPHKCGFCHAAVLWKQRIAYRSPENVVEEIQHLIKDYGVEEIHFEDENLVANRDRALALFHLIRERSLPVIWNVPYGIAPGSLDDELLEAMAQSGCYEVALAVESCNEHVLTNVIGKPNFLADIPRIISTCKRLGIFVYGFFIVGLPGETMKHVKQTLKTPARLGFMDAYFSIWVPLPGTRLYEQGIAEGIIRSEDIRFSDLHMTARIPRYKGPAIETLEKIVARASWRFRLGRIVHPLDFYSRYVRPVLRNPGFGLRYLWDQIRLAIFPRRKKA